jgi:hypothetical protein
MGVPLSGPLIADFSKGQRARLPVLEASYRPVLLGATTSEIKNAAWHVTGDLTAADRTGSSTGAGIVLGCVDTSAYTGVSLTIDSTASDCLGASIAFYAANGGSLQDSWRVVGKMKETIKVPLVQWDARGALSEIDVIPFSSAASCKFDWTIDDVTFYSDPSVTVSSGFQMCPPGLATRVAGSLVADFSTGSADGVPVLPAPFVPFLLGDVASDVSNGTWHLVGDTAAANDLVGAGILFGCVDLSNVSGLSLTIDQSGSSCAGAFADFVDWTDTLLYRANVTTGAATTVRVDATDLGKGKPYASGLKKVTFWPTVAGSCRFEWRIDDVTFH